MKILKIKDPQDLRDAIEASSRWSPAADALDAERRDAIALAPNNRHMRAHPVLGPIIGRTIGCLGDEQVDVTAPVIRAISGARDHSTERIRDGRSPLPQGGVVSYCVECNLSQRDLVPFWVAFPPYVIQVDLCGGCADFHVFERGAIPQVAD